MFALGAAQLDVEKQLITLGDRTVFLQRKPYLVLLYLIENRHRMVHRRELLDRFWDGKEVYDQSLSKAVGSIRKALGDSEGELIETRWGLGYRYIGPFVELPVAAARPELTSEPPADAADAREAGALHNAEPVAESVSVSRDTVLPPLAVESKFFWQTALALILVAAAAAALTAFALHQRQTARHRDAALAGVHSVAVLPFTAASDDLQGQYLGLELADTVAGRLSSLPQLNVRSSATVRSVVGLEADPGTAGKRLEVQALVTGEVREGANGSMVSVHVLDGATGASRWSGTFTAGSADLIHTEDAIAGQLSKILAPQSSSNALRPSTGDTNDAEAYSDYMKARFFATTRTHSSLEKAITLLHAATARDPNYARAWAALAESYSLEGFYSYVAPADAYPRAKEAALKALALDNSLLEAHVSLMSILTDYDWNWNGSEREFHAAIAIDPDYAVAYQYYGYTLLAMGRGEEALVAMKQAAEIDPVSPSVQTSLAWAEYQLRMNQQTVEQCRKVLDLYPDYVPAHQLLGLTYSLLRQDEPALAELKHAGALEPTNSMNPLFIDYVLARAGRSQEASRSLDEIVAKSGDAFIPDYLVAAAWTAIGDNRKAETFLDRALEFRSNWLINLHYDPRFDPLRSDARFQSIVSRIGPPPAATTLARR